MKLKKNGNFNWTPFLFLNVLAVKKKKYLLQSSEQLKENTLWRKRYFHRTLL